MSIVESELTRLIHASARYLDDHNFDAFLALFSEEGEYAIVVQAPEIARPMTWMQGSKSELAERFAAVPRQKWEIAEHEQTRLVSVDLLTVHNDTTTSSSSFAVFNTDSDGRSSCYVVGRYEDLWQEYGGSWYLKKREVVLKTRLLTTLSPLPI